MKKNKDPVKHLEKDLLKTAKAAVTKYDKDITSLIGPDKDEKELRDKLVTKLKQKEIEKMKECGEMRDKIRENAATSFSYSENDDEGSMMEDISDEELDVITHHQYKNWVKNLIFGKITG